MRYFMIIAAALTIGGCARNKVELPKTVLPDKPESSTVAPERLSEIEKSKCKETGPEAKNVCRKVEKNAVIAEDQQKFVDRLYEERQGR